MHLIRPRFPSLPNKIPKTDNITSLAWNIKIPNTSGKLTHKVLNLFQLI